MHKQAIFDLAVKRAKEMKSPAVSDYVDEDGTVSYNACSYRSPTGPCLIGAMIKDEFYHENLEGKSITPSVVKALLDSEIISFDENNHKHTGFLNYLQNCHDTAKDFPDDFVNHLHKQLKNFAVKYGLKFEDYLNV